MRSLRRRASMGALVTGLAVAASVPVLTQPVTAAEVRTETDLGGFFAVAEAAPARVLIDDPAVPIPRPPDSAILEADPAYTYATFITGPSGRSVASSLWPGNLIGTGTGTLTNNAADYPLAAGSEFPGGSPTASQSAGPFTMESETLGLDVIARARTQNGGPQASPIIQLGNVESTSSVTTVKDATSKDAVKDVAVARAVSKVSDVLLLGVLQIDSVVTSIEARSDAVTGTSTGTTTVSGLSVMGKGYTVDDKGVRPSEGAAQPIPGLPAPLADPLKTLGFTVEPVGQSVTDSGVQGQRAAKGLKITVDTVLFRKTVSDIPGFNDTLGDVFAQVPDIPGAPQQPKGLLFYTLASTPKISFVFGDANVLSSASLPLVLDLPPLDLGGGDFIPGTPGSPGTPGTPGTSGTPGFTSGPSTVGQPVVGGPPVAAGPTGEVPLTGVLSGSRDFDDPFNGLGPLVVLAGLLFAGFGARGLLGLQAAAIGGAAVGGPGCALGAPDDLPDLRSTASLEDQR